jgi:hypothetical protein
MMADGEGSTTSFVDLPDDIHLEIAQIIDPRICSLPSSVHADDPVYTDYAYASHSPSRPNQTLTRLTRVCKRLQRIYAPLSTWRNLFIQPASSYDE